MQSKLVLPISPVVLTREERAWWENGDVSPAALGSDQIVLTEDDNSDPGWFLDIPAEDADERE